MGTHIKNLNLQLQGRSSLESPARPLRWLAGEDVKLSREQQVRLYIQPTTLAGNPAPMDGPARWTADGICTLTPIDDHSVWRIPPETGVGDTVVNVEADADLGAGVVLLRDSTVVHTTDPMAAQLGLGADAPVLKPPA